MCKSFHFSPTKTSLLKEARNAATLRKKYALIKTDVCSILPNMVYLSKLKIFTAILLTNVSLTKPMIIRQATLGGEGVQPQSPHCRHIPAQIYFHNCEQECFNEYSDKSLSNLTPVLPSGRVTEVSNLILMRRLINKDTI